MLTATSELVRLDDAEIDLISKYRKCNPERQDVLQHIALELAKQTQADRPWAGNVVLLTGRPLK